jgi:hypothetical protein
VVDVVPVRKIVAAAYKIAVTALFLGAIGGFVACDFMVNGPIAAAKQAELEEEMLRIAGPPGAILTRSSASHKAETAFVDRDYQSSLNYRQLRAYYDAELSRNGWWPPRRCSFLPVLTPTFRRTITG